MAAATLRHGDRHPRVVACRVILGGSNWHVCCHTARRAATHFYDSARVGNGRACDSSTPRIPAARRRVHGAARRAARQPRDLPRANGCAYRRRDAARIRRARHASVSPLRRAPNQLHALVSTAPEPLREGLRHLEHECVQGRVPATFIDAHRLVGGYIDGFYNTVRLHSTIGLVSPVELESRCSPSGGGIRNPSVRPGGNPPLAGITLGGSGSGSRRTSFREALPLLSRCPSPAASSSRSAATSTAMRCSTLGTGAWLTCSIRPAVCARSDCSQGSPRVASQECQAVLQAPRRLSPCSWA
jgi:hypothetical protein